MTPRVPGGCPEDRLKFIMIVPDGAADEPIGELGGKTPLEAARTPHLDALAGEGAVGSVRTIPEDMEPGSDVANISILGYDVATVYTGRAPLEAAGLGIPLRDDQTAWRCNLITEREGILEDFSAGHITTEAARPVVEALKGRLASDEIDFHLGVGYRHLMVTGELTPPLPRTVPPHDIMGRPWKDHLPSGRGADFLIDLMMRSREILSGLSSDEDSPANMIWLWGGGTRPKFPAFRDLYGLRGAAVTAVDLVAGIARLIGWDRIPVEGATAYLDTNYAGKAAAVIERLDEYDFLFLHVEAPDEAGHLGKAELKVKAVEDIDHHIVEPIRAEALARGNVRILVLPDHPTPVARRTHTRGRVPFLLWGPGLPSHPCPGFCERCAADTGLAPAGGRQLMQMFLAT